MAIDSGSAMTIAGIVLAGGLSRRMGGREKALIPLGGRPLLALVIERARPQVAALAISANGDPAHYAAFALPVLADSIPGNVGPLAGILAGLDWAARAVPGATHLASFACDTPFLPRALVARLAGAMAGQRGRVACAASGDRVHPVFALWSLDLREELRSALVVEGVRKVDAWTARYGPAIVAFEAAPHDPFFNINAPEQLAEAERLLAQSESGQDGGR